MHLKTTFYWALAIESPKVKGRAALGASSDVEPASWGAAGAVCLSVSRAADFAVREVPCHSVGLKGLPCSPGGFLCAKGALVLQGALICLSWAPGLPQRKPQGGK